jgi:release factor glutamine methyltransferase
MVNEAVMIPCPETEQLLESVLRTARHCRLNPVRLLDVGVGSGVLAVSAKLENEELDITAIDISPTALEVARANAAAYEIENQIRFLQSNLFSALDRNERFDIIASNPPYIAAGDYDTLPPEVKADPVTALLAGEKGLDIITRLVHEAPDYLNRPGFLMFEIGHNQSQDVFGLIDRDGRYAEFALLKDFADIDRIVVCKVDLSGGH